MQYRVRESGDLGAAIAEFRELRGVTQAELAERIGVHRTYLSRIERGDLTTVVERIVAALSELDAEIVIRARS